MHSEIIAEIYLAGGELLSQNSTMMKITVSRYKKLLRKAGKELVENMKLSGERIEKLNKPLMSDQQYIKSANKYWDRMLSKAGVTRGTH